ncbi:MAG: S41 family peptidase [Myxococcota bacterium]
MFRERSTMSPSGAPFHRPWWMGWVGVGLGFVAGLWVGALSPADAEPPANPYARLNTFAKVMSYIERSYVTPVDQEKLLDQAIKGMVSSLDPHSLYLPPEAYQALRQENNGAFVGVGLEIESREGLVHVVAPIDGAPADRAGVLSGDLVTAIDGNSVRGLTLREVVQRLKGPEGSSVTLTLLRAPTPVSGRKPDLTQAKPITLTLVRQTITVVAVAPQMMEPGWGYVRLRSFQDGVADDLIDAYNTLRAETGDLHGLVLDLRNNPGGLLLEAVQVADLFIDEGVLVSTEGRTRKGNAVYRAAPAETRIQVPLVVLINEGSASASEIVAGALKEHGRATVVGVRSFGKGSVQSIIDMKDGSGLKLTTALYYTPNHTSIHGKGIEPDLEIVQIPETTRSGSPSEPWYASDIQLRTALQHVKAMVSLHKRQEPSPADK